METEMPRAALMGCTGHSVVCKSFEWLDSDVVAGLAFAGA